MEVDGASLIPARIDRDERDYAVRIGHLVASEELLVNRIHWSEDRYGCYPDPRM